MRSTKPMLIAKIGYIVMSAICAFFGTALVIGNKNLLLSDFGTLIAIFMIVFGAVKLLGYFSKDLFRLAFQHDMASGFLMAIIGVFVFFKPDDAANNMHIILGLLAAADGLLKIQISLDSKKFGIKLWWLIFAVAILCCCVGLGILFRPDAFLRLMTLFVGILLMTEGVLNLLVVIFTVKIVKHQKRDEIDTDEK